MQLHKLGDELVSRVEKKYFYEGNTSYSLVISELRTILTIMFIKLGTFHPLTFQDVPTLLKDTLPIGYQDLVETIYLRRHDDISTNYK